MKKILIAAFVIVGFTSFAQDNCPNPKPLRSICDHVSSPIDMDGVPSHIYKLKAAACVLPTDSVEEEGRKIREMWAKYEDLLKCSTGQYYGKDINIIKATVKAIREDFIYQVIEWKVNLNRIDKDKMTVLDFVKNELKSGPAPQTKKQLENYYDLLKRNGAKHSSELY